MDKFNEHGGGDETVKNVYDEMTGWEHHTWMSSTDHEYIESLATRALAAHKREIAEKDAEIERLKADYIRCRDELRATRERRDVCETKMRTALERVTRAESKCDSLRSLVNGLLEASSTECADCMYDCGPNRENCIVHEAAKYIEEGEVKR